MAYSVKLPKKAYALTASYNGAVLWDTLSKKRKTMIPFTLTEDEDDPNTLDSASSTASSLLLNANGYKHFRTTTPQEYRTRNAGQCSVAVGRLMLSRRYFAK